MVLIKPGRNEPYKLLLDTTLVVKGDCGPRVNTEAEHAVGRAPALKAVITTIKVHIDVTAPNNAVVLLLENAERVLQGVVSGKLLVDALIAAEHLIHHIRVFQVAGNRMLDVPWQQREDIGVRDHF